MNLSIIKNASLIIVSAVITVAGYNYADVGRVNDVSLQSSYSSITAAEFAMVRNGLINIESAPVEIDGNSAVSVSYSVPVRKDASSLEKNTFLISSDSENPYFELTDPSTFTYDGSSYWVDVSLVNIRESPAVESDVLGQAEKGDSLIRISYGTMWSMVRTVDGLEGYVLTDLLTDEEVVVEEIPEATPTPTPVPVATNTPTPVPQSSVNETTAETTVATFTESAYSATLYTTCSLNVRTGPGTSYSMVRVLSAGDSVSVIAQTDNGWYKTSDGYYVKADLCSVNAPTPTPVPAAPSESTSSGYSDFASYCLQFVGTPYVYAASSPSGFDCSGLVMYVYANYYGISLPHNAASIAGMGTSVSPENIQCGDVMCHDYNGDGYIDHVSIYLGNGTCIHASDSRHGVITSTYPMNCITTIRRFI